MLLAGDVGATKILLEAGEFRSGHWEPRLARRYLISDYDNFSEVVERFLGEMDGDGRHIDAAAIGAAGLVQGNRVTMTNRAWCVDGDILMRRHGVDRAVVLNDLAAAAQGVDVLDGSEFIEIQPGEAQADAPRVVLGVGTGLGVAYLVPQRTPGTDPEPRRSQNQGASLVVASEGGHMGFSPASAPQVELWQAMLATRPRVEAEDVCSGRGISNIYEVLRRRGDCPAGAPECADAGWIAQQAAEKKDGACTLALDLFAECLGNIAGDHALTVMARGGVILAGGVVAKLAPLFNTQRFREAFCAKGAFSSELMRIPVKLATSERIALIGAARVANLL